MAVSNKRPLQIYLRPEQNEALKEMSKRTGRSKADLIRESLDRYLSQMPPDEDPLVRIVGMGHSEKGDLAERHDEYVEQAVRSKKRRG